MDFRTKTFKDNNMPDPIDAMSSVQQHALK